MTTNGEKYKTAKERGEAFLWLDLEAKAEAEEPLPCPFCDASRNIMRETNSAGGWIVRCYTCGYRSMVHETEAAAIAAHNRVARAAKGKEAAK